jgi:hypothetical protein
MYLGGDESLTSRSWIDTNVRQEHGPLGALYPPKTWTAPNPNSALKEGDTPSWLFFLSNGLGDPAHPEWGGWGGRLQRGTDGVYRDARDKVGDVQDARATVWRWRPAFQNQFQARMDWCVKPYAEANHAPMAVLNGDTMRRAVQVAASPGGVVRLSAAGSSDPDGGALSYRWWVYAEAGTYGGAVSLAEPDRAETSVTAPADAAGKTIHIILEVTDGGNPPLAAYRRCVLSVSP